MVKWEITSAGAFDLLLFGFVLSLFLFLTNDMVFLLVLFSASFFIFIVVMGFKRFLGQATVLIASIPLIFLINSLQGGGETIFAESIGLGAHVVTFALYREGVRLALAMVLRFGVLLFGVPILLHPVRLWDVLAFSSRIEKDLGLLVASAVSNVTRFARQFEEARAVEAMRFGEERGWVRELRLSGRALNPVFRRSMEDALVYLEAMETRGFPGTKLDPLRANPVLLSAALILFIGILLAMTGTGHLFFPKGEIAMRILQAITLTGVIFAGVLARLK